MPPRLSEGNTHLDLAIGAIAKCGTTKSGIELNDWTTPWVCFCEMKWDSDITLGVTHDPNRNQLARVIETALCFQIDGVYAVEIYVALVTPARFKDSVEHPKEYSSTFKEYDADPARLLQDLDSCVLQKRSGPDWQYPDHIAGRVERLNLRWPTFEDLFSKIPDSEISAGIKRFWEQYGY